jgi:hypothetical protein
MPEAVTITLENVNWRRLRHQKQALVDVLETCTINDFTTVAEDKHLTALLHLIDHVQDQAALVLGETAVFG